VDVLGEQATTQLLDLAGGDDPHCAKRVGILPAVVEDSHAGVPTCQFLRRDTQPAMDRLLRHRLMGSQSNQVVQCRHLAPQQLVKQSEEQVNGTTARAIGNDDQHPLAGQLRLGQRLAHQLADLIFRQKSIGIAFAYQHQHLREIGYWILGIGYW